MSIPQLKCVIASTLEATRVVLSHAGLRETLVVILRLGNFLNHVCVFVVDFMLIHCVRQLIIFVKIYFFENYGSGGVELLREAAVPLSNPLVFIFI